jgi:RHS repeat-associated protein
MPGQRDLSTNAGGINFVPLLITGADTKSFRWSFYGWDQLGSVRAVSSEMGDAISASGYEPFGRSFATGGPGSVLGFTGHENDMEIGLTYMRARQYSPLGDRFLTPDPIQGGPGSPGAWNRFSYVGNSPINWSDPTGLVREQRVDGCLACGGSWTAHNSTGGQNSKGQWNTPSGILFTSNSMTVSNGSLSFNSQSVFVAASSLSSSMTMGLMGTTPFFAPEGTFDKMITAARSDIHLLQRLIFAEAAGQYRISGAMEGVGYVVKNRVDSSQFPNSYSGVIHQKNQFDSVGKTLWNAAANPGSMSSANQAAYRRAGDVARSVYFGMILDPTGGALYFHSGPISASPWFQSALNSGRISPTVVIGPFSFYR